MDEPMIETTWDGLPVAREKPYGASILVWRRARDGRRWLVLHRGRPGVDDAGDWAWTPPAGARLPGEAVLACAERELREETGLSLPLTETGLGGDDWPLFAAEAPPDAEVRLDDEHDRYEWLSLEDAAARCFPAFVGESFSAVAASLP
ncbi:MAG: NUDIX domain-containing protein [Gaiellaceae bacterium]